ncbi:apolipoprotein N-acyltransferase [Neisseria shayeganii]|uniref:Apolipoprotein N-acyltransferase n=1 Tax=Neisseria shayeganii 871 TaxID=1032488 RepID=G4CIA7_9NEIS|nr:apolipoprotein N-acyltransferase [Neisseria shayeganii]EGY52440.1 apolipoprotein N-acyltransferase [Neisseria shayeganii 871]
MSPAARLDDCFRRPLAYWPSLFLIAAATPFAFAPYYQFWLMPLLLAALIFLTELRPTISVRSAYLFGLIGYTAQFYWVHTALHDVSGLPNLYALPLTLLLPAYLALYPAACFWLLEKSALSRPWRIGLLLPLLWTLTEFARERALTGFGWGALGYSQIADFSPLAGYAPVGGLHLVTLVCAFSGAWLFLCLRSHFWRQRFFYTLLLGMLFGGGWLLRHTAFTTPDGSSNSVALAQGNVPQTLKWQPEQLSATIQNYYEQVARTQADILILPETALPLMRQDLQTHHPGVLDQFAYEAQRNGSALAIGMAQYNAERTGYLNAVLNLSHYHPDRPDDIPYYAKDHLVPFGEYKPLPALTEPLYKMMNMPLADFDRGGTSQAPLELARQKVAFNICYEDGFGDELIASAKQSSLLANVSNMAWYGQSNAMFQHLQQSQTRALELGRYMVRATNTGATAIINPQGRIVAAAKADTRMVLEGTVQGYQGQTPFMRMGGSLPFIGFCLALALTLLLLGRKQAAPSNKPNQPFN